MQAVAQHFGHGDFVAVCEELTDLAVPSITGVAVSLLVSSFGHDLHVGNLSENLIKSYAALIFQDLDVF